MNTDRQCRRRVGAAAVLAVMAGQASALDTSNTTVQDGRININHTFQCGDDNVNGTLQTGRININHTIQRCPPARRGEREASAGRGSAVRQDGQVGRRAGHASPGPV